MDLSKQEHEAVFKFEVIAYLRTRYYNPYSVDIQEIYEIYDGDIGENQIEKAILNMDTNSDCPLRYNKSNNRISVSSTTEADNYIDEIKDQMPYYD
ncbi:uncharacterized protein Nmag_3690 (plasmid) [Natrialba magadii ATCC 43099]|uniref:Uncharacterized protein n=1 Tax=Natrialba magadii (strain ATCC 43099 / DSM 3394 / CCM 3739 / CIP 104546 / IAM 13178 / JCM 8861 / NBRC 102185 / NCIMB 2190 / MS3) TaxID=547559 RepID=D3T0X5_NATMM|nr:uncharacterized protein Nmag_3690 [Natrialba magadii ATCC 43099]ELY34344.1 hypothetical protein C500_00377 [Natrialba magadii ATCC 43099]